MTGPDRAKHKIIQFWHVDHPPEGTDGLILQLQCVFNRIMKMLTVKYSVMNNGETTAEDS